MGSCIIIAFKDLFDFNFFKVTLIVSSDLLLLAARRVNPFLVYVPILYSFVPNCKGGRTANFGEKTFKFIYYKKMPRPPTIRQKKSTTFPNPKFSSVFRGYKIGTLAGKRLTSQHWDHSFSRFTTFSEKLIFLTP